MSANMTTSDLNTLLQYIHRNNSPFSPGRMYNGKQGPVIKYVDPVIDMRDGRVFSVRLRGFGGRDVNFYTGNEHIDNPLSLEERIYHYLATGEIT